MMSLKVIKRVCGGICLNLKFGILIFVVFYWRFRVEILFIIDLDVEV